MGGPMSVNDPLPYLQEEIALIRTALARSQPVLGICLGSQLLAKALGASVYRNSAKEIGWYDLSLAEAAGYDPVFSRMQPVETVFHWHSEVFDLPPGAIWLARSALCRNQAFRFGANAYGMQFHLEVTPAMIADWCLQDENCGDVRELDAPIDPNVNAPRLGVLAAEVFGAWCDLL